MTQYFKKEHNRHDSNIHKQQKQEPKENLIASSKYFQLFHIRVFNNYFYEKEEYVKAFRN